MCNIITMTQTNYLYRLKIYEIARQITELNQGRKKYILHHVNSLQNDECGKLIPAHISEESIFFF